MCESMSVCLSRCTLTNITDIELQSLCIDKGREQRHRREAEGEREGERGGRRERRKEREEEGEREGERGRRRERRERRKEREEEGERCVDYPAESKHRGD